MASRKSGKKGKAPVIPRSKDMHSDLAEYVLLALAKTIPKRRFGRHAGGRSGDNPGDAFYKLASAAFARIISVYPSLNPWSQGRDAVRFRKKSKVMVYFLNIRDDPRVSRDYPRKLGIRNKLSLPRDEFRRLQKEKKLVVTRKTKEVEGEDFIKPALALAQENIRSQGIVKISKTARDLIKHHITPKGLRTFSI